MATRPSTSRATLGTTKLAATTEQPGGHALREDLEPNTNTIDSAEADFSKGQGSSDTPVAAAATASASAAVEPTGGRSNEAGGAEEVVHAPSMAAVTQEGDTAVGLGQTAEEAEVMAELLAQQPGGQEEAGDEAAPAPMVSNAVLICMWWAMCLHFPYTRLAQVEYW